VSVMLLFWVMVKLYGISQVSRVKVTTAETRVRKPSATANLTPYNPALPETQYILVKLFGAI
jgi:hypothetical protein